MRPEAERLVEQLFQQWKDPAAVAAAVRALHGRSEVFQRELQRAIWRRGG